MHYRKSLHKLSFLLIIILFLNEDLLANNKIENIDFEANQLIDFVENKKEQEIKNHQAEVDDIIKKTAEIKTQNNYKKSIDWLAKNNQKLFSQQTKKLPKIDYDIDDNHRKNDAIAQLLHNYRFKSDEIKKTSISHYPLMIFVSASIPKESLKDLMYQAKKAGAVLVFNGLIGNLKNTQEFLSNISKDDLSAIIDPRLFELFQIKIVPTFVILNDVLQDCEKNNCQLSPLHDRIAGNITLQYALEQFAQDAKENSLVFEFLKKIKGDNEL